MTNQMAKEAGKGGIRLYAGATPADKRWDRAEKGREAIKKADEVAKINSAHYYRCLAKENAKLRFGHQLPNPSIYGHDTMVGGEKQWKSRHLKQREFERKERNKMMEDAKKLMAERNEELPARYDTPPPSSHPKNFSFKTSRSENHSVTTPSPT
jgi:hypothetical protein